jgi:hypothetical protein
MNRPVKLRRELRQINDKEMDIQTELCGNIGRRYVRNNRIKLGKTQTRCLHIQFKSRISYGRLTYPGSIKTGQLYGTLIITGHP